MKPSQNKDIKANQPIPGNTTNNTPIHMAAYGKEPDELTKLVDLLPPTERRDAVNAPNLFGVTPLHEAIWIGMSLKTFARHHPTEKQDEYRQSYNTSLANMPQTVEILLKNGANPLNMQKAKVNGDIPVNGEVLSFTIMQWLDYQLSGKPEGSKERKALATSKNIINQHISVQNRLLSNGSKNCL